MLLATPYRVTRSQRVRFLPRMSVTSSGFAGNCGECKARKKKRQIKHDPNHLATKGGEAGEESGEELEGRMENEGLVEGDQGYSRTSVSVELSSGTLRFYADSPEMSGQFRN